MIEPDIRTHIEATLAAAAAEHGVRILYAAESGSRAWGFASPDSDYDVRFIYAHPLAWYVRLGEDGAVIERPHDDRLVDLAGWDLRKALRLLLKSNPTLHEWLVSPFVYIDSPLRTELAGMFKRHASPRVLAHHYGSIARTAWKREIEGREQVRLKKYFYVVRPLLSLAWVAEHRTPPPMAIDELLARVPMPAAPRAAIDALLAEKRATPELASRPPIAAIDAWAQDMFAQLDPERLDLPGEAAANMVEQADHLFRSLIGLRL
jgi:predicted nucleotidyltransferase